MIKLACCLIFVFFVKGMGLVCFCWNVCLNYGVFFVLSLIFLFFFFLNFWYIYVCSLMAGNFANMTFRRCMLLAVEAVVGVFSTCLFSCLFFLSSLCVQMKLGAVIVGVIFCSHSVLFFFFFSFCRKVCHWTRYQSSCTELAPRVFQVCQLWQVFGRNWLCQDVWTVS